MEKGNVIIIERKKQKSLAIGLYRKKKRGVMGFGDMIIGMRRPKAKTAYFFFFFFFWGGGGGVYA